jgi:hypothetical protein
MNKEEWLKRYAARMIERGLDNEEVKAMIECTSMMMIQNRLLMMN